MNKIKKTYKRINNYFPLFAIIAYFIFFTATIIHVLSLFSVSFSDFFNRNISTFVRMVLAKLTNWFPYSIAELVVLLLPLIFIGVLITSFKVTNKNKREMIRYAVTFLSVITFFYSAFVYGFATGYQASTLEQNLGLERLNVTNEELYHTADILLKEANQLANEVDFIYGSSSVMPYNLKEMNRILNETYLKLSDEYYFLPRLKTNIKSILLSEPMTYTHISGVYTYYTGEANININFPDYTIVFTAAHELAHQRGIAREDEANFMAFLVCLTSDDVYMNYCAYINMYEYVINALYEADVNLYMKLLSQMDMRVRNEMVTYNNFFEKYKDSSVSNISNTINDTFLKSQGQTEGSKSYGRVVDLAVAYYR